MKKDENGLEETLQQEKMSRDRDNQVFGKGLKDSQTSGHPCCAIARRNI